MANNREVSETILIAAGSAISYAVAFAYRSGYGSHFGLPPLLLSPSLGVVLQAAGVVGLVALSFWNIAFAVWPWMPRGNSARDIAIRRVALFCIVMSALIFQMADGWRAWAILAAILGFFVFLEFILPLIAHRKVSGYENKLLAQEDIERNTQQYSLTSLASGLIGDGLFRLIAVAVLVVMLANLVGTKVAKNQTEFYILKDSPGHVVAAMDDAVVILAGYDEKTLALTGSYQVERISESRPWTFQKRFIGRLSAPQKPAKENRQGAWRSQGGRCLLCCY